MVPYAACFDVGGVLIGADRPGLCGRVTTALGVPVEEVRKELNQHFLTSNKPLSTAIEDFSDAVDVEPATVADAIIPIGTDTCYIYDDVVPVVEQIHEQMPVVTVSNTNPWERVPIAETPLDSYVDATINSFEVGMAKPDQEIFTEALAAVDVPIDQTDVVMIGDSWVDVEGAAQLGWDTILIHREDSAIPPTQDDIPTHVISNFSSLLQHV